MSSDMEKGFQKANSLESFRCAICKAYMELVESLQGFQSGSGHTQVHVVWMEMPNMYTREYINPNEGQKVICEICTLLC